MNKDFTQFEKNIREGMEGFEMPFDQSGWESMNRRLDGKRVSWNSTMAAAVVTGLIFISGFTYVAVKTDFVHLNKTKTEEIIADSSSEIPNSDSGSSDLSNIIGAVELEENELTAKNTDADLNQITSTPDLVDSDSSEDLVNNENSINSINPKVEAINASKELVADNAKLDGAKSLKEVSSEVGLIDVHALEIETEIEGDLGNSSAPYINVSQSEVCAGEKIQFMAENITEEDKFLWNFGNADFSTEISPVRVFDVPGEYNISLILSKSSRKIESQVIILPKPSAKFTWKEQEKGAIRLSNLSEKAASSEWKVGEGFESHDINPIYHYNSDGKQLVSLKVVNEFGCADSSLRYIQLTAPMVISAPTELKFGEEFVPEVKGLTSEYMVLTVHNLAGQLVFETDENAGWNGKMPDGNYAGPGSEFAWLVVVKNTRGMSVSSNSGIVKIIP